MGKRLSIPIQSNFTILDRFVEPFPVKNFSDFYLCMYVCTYMYTFVITFKMLIAHIKALWIKTKVSK